MIGIGGAHSGAGKTLVGCRILHAMGPGWGAIKCTPTALYSAVIDDPAIVGQPGKDTARYAEAGAELALWVQGPREALAESLDMAMCRLAGLRGVIVEGNTAIELLKPDIVIFIVGEPGRVKPGASSAIESAHVVIHAGGLSGGPLEREFGIEDEEAYIAHVRGEVLKRDK